MSAVTLNVLNAGSDVEAASFSSRISGERSIDKLSEQLRKIPSVRFLLIISGFLSPHVSEIHSVVDCVGYIVLLIVCWTVRAGFIVFSVYNFLDSFIYAPNSSNSISHYYQAVCVVLQTITVMPLAFYLKKRLESKAYLRDIEHFFHVTSTCYAYNALSLLFAFLYYFIPPINGAVVNNVPGHVFIHQSHYIVSAFGEFTVSLLFSGCLMFILVDTKVSEAIIQDLIEKTKNEQLNVEYYNISRIEIQRRTDGLFNVTTIFIIVAFMNILGFFLKIFVTEAKSGIGAIFSACNYYLKEIMVIIICYYYTAKVNDLADVQIQHLGFDKWKDEMTRLQVFVNASSRKISFELAGMRFKSKDMWIRFGGGLLTALLGLIRIIVLKH